MSKQTSGQNLPDWVQTAGENDEQVKLSVYEQPLPNYTLSTVCPSCGASMYRLACKVRCERCGFMWDCSEL